MKLETILITFTAAFFGLYTSSTALAEGSEYSLEMRSSGDSCEGEAEGIVIDERWRDFEVRYFNGKFFGGLSEWVNGPSGLRDFFEDEELNELRLDSCVHKAYLDIPKGCTPYKWVPTTYYRIKSWAPMGWTRAEGYVFFKQIGGYHFFPDSPKGPDDIDYDDAAAGLNDQIKTNFPFLKELDPFKHNPYNLWHILLQWTCHMAVYYRCCEPSNTQNPNGDLE